MTKSRAAQSWAVLLSDNWKGPYLFKPLGKKSQLDLLVQHFAKLPSISAMEAQALYRIRALPRRIKDLKERGVMAFRHEEREDVTGQRYVRYYAVPKAA